MIDSEPAQQDLSGVAQSRGRIRQAAGTEPKLAEKRGRLKDLAYRFRRRLQLGRWFRK